MIFGIVICERLEERCGAHVIEQPLDRIITKSQGGDDFVVLIENLLHAVLRRDFHGEELDKEFWN